VGYQEEIAAGQRFLYEDCMRDGIYVVEFSDLGTGLKSKGIATIDCFRFDAAVDGKVFWGDYTQDWEVLSATLYSSRYRSELARRRVRRDWLYKTTISPTEEGFEVIGEAEGEIPGKISMRGRWIADLPWRELQPDASHPARLGQSKDLPSVARDQISN
jgi:hypothetical protein